MEIALLGSGKMGSLIEKLALKRGYRINAKFNSISQPWQTASKADVWLDFSHASFTEDVIHQAIDHKKNLLIGTTGFNFDFNAIKNIVKGHAILIAPNCSIGVILYYKMLERAAELMKPFKDYLVQGFEVHHAKKKDSPSGTAKAISKRMTDILERKVSFNSQRLGNYFGTHTICFNSPEDKIRLTHEAKSRDGFALGALKAAEWLLGKEGIFTLDDYIEGVLCEA